MSDVSVTYAGLHQSFSLLSSAPFLQICLHPINFSLDPTLKWSEMTEHLRRDDDNPSEDLRGSQPSAIILNLPHFIYLKFLHNKSILET